MNIPRLGDLTQGDDNEYQSQPIAVPVLGGEMCSFIIEGYDDDEDKEAFHIAIANFLTLNDSALKAAEPHVFQYCQDSEEGWRLYGKKFKTIKSPAEVWKHVHFGSEPVVSRRDYGDKAVYISLECNCDWEVEHGLQIVFKNGLVVNKVGPYDGHLTNSDAFGDKRLENVVYAGH